jgi:hypothetical protein
MGGGGRKGCSTGGLLLLKAVDDDDMAVGIGWRGNGGSEAMGAGKVVAVAAV